MTRCYLVYMWHACDCLLALWVVRRLRVIGKVISTSPTVSAHHSCSLTLTGKRAVTVKSAHCQPTKTKSSSIDDDKLLMQ